MKSKIRENKWRVQEPVLNQAVLSENVGVQHGGKSSIHDQGRPSAKYRNYEANDNPNVCMTDTHAPFAAATDPLVSVYSNDNHDERSESVAQIGKKPR